MANFADQVDGDISYNAALELAGRSASVFAAFEDTATSNRDLPFLCIPARADRAYYPDGAEFSYGDALSEIRGRAERFAEAGIGVGHRVALMLDNRPEHFFNQLALYRLGATQVPVNPDYLDHELHYLLDHSEANLAIGHDQNIEHLARVAGPLEIPVAKESDARFPLPAGQVQMADEGRRREAAIIYTSGTTGRPKGCVLDHEYHFQAGLAYAGLRGRLSLGYQLDRIFVPLPVFHVNAGINTLTAVILTGNCLILPDRFHPGSWWEDIVLTNATAMHYLGVVPPILLNREPCEFEGQHRLRFGLGAGVDPTLHQAFEERFNVPMVEVWGMTETGRFIGDCHEPRRTHTRAFGKAEGAIEARVADENGEEVPTDAAGELLVRAVGDDPRFGFFRGYLKDDEATEEAWRDGWFHTGDVVTREADGMLHFVERRKNIIRRSGENISAAEVENALITDPRIQAVAVIGVMDELRDEEVMACLVVSPDVAPTEATALAVFDRAKPQLAYYKLPGWIAFVDDLPRTGTQKIQKTLIFSDIDDPRTAPRVFDLRRHKKRGQ